MLLVPEIFKSKFEVVFDVSPRNNASVGISCGIPSKGIFVRLSPRPENPAPVEVIIPDDLIVPITSRAAAGFSNPIPIFPVSIIVILFNPLVLKTRLLFDNNIELLESKSKSILLLYIVIIIIKCIYKKK